MEEYNKSGRAEEWAAKCAEKVAESQTQLVPKYSREGKKHPTNSELTTKILEYIGTV